MRNINVDNFSNLTHKFQFHDVKTKAVTSTSVFAVSFAVTFAQSYWRGKSIKDATIAAFGCAVLGGSTILLTGIISAQLLRTGIGVFGATSVNS